MMNRRTRWAAIGLLILTGCSSIGPRTINRDRFDYTTAIAESWKSQMLLNIVKVRYGDTPVFLDVPSVINQYAIQGRINLGANWENGPGAIDSQMVGVEGLYAERPTITYAPLTGDKFTKSLLTPLPPASLLFLIQSGWPVKLLFELCVKAINDIDNRSTVPGFARPSDPKFQKLVELLARIQKSGAVGARIIKKDQWESAMLILRRKADPEIAPDISEVRKMLGIKGDTPEITVTYGSTPAVDNEIAMLTRSIMDIILEMSSQIDVPEENVAEGRTYATSPEIGPGRGQAAPFSRVYTGMERPADAFTAIKYRGHWYWIDDRDRPAKSHFTFLMVLFSLAETGAAPQVPLITVPVN